MGDGRYYTYYQFFGILILVLLSIFVLSSMVVGYYRNSGNKNEKQFFYMFFGLSLLIILKIVEFVIPKNTMGLILRSSICILLMFLIIEWLNYLNLYIFKMASIIPKHTSLVVIVCIILSTIFTKGTIFFVTYDFFKTKFTAVYVILWILIAVFILIYILRIALSKKQIHKIYRNRNSAFLLLFFVLLPQVIYCFVIIKKIPIIDFAEILIFVMLAAIFNIVMYSQSPSGITVLTFNKIGDIINDYVLVTDLKGKIIYTNQIVNQSPLFVVKESVDLENIEKLYKPKAIKLHNTEGNEYIKLKDGGNIFYFMHQVDQLKDHEKIIGYIITIVDISELMELLNLLNDMKNQAKEVNEKLKNYAKVVYNIEREKQINILLENILSSREKDVEKLIEYIEELIKNENLNETEDIYEEINSVIRFNQQILEDVRKTVSSYM